MRRRLFIASTMSAAALSGCGAIGTPLNDLAAVRNALGVVDLPDEALADHGLAREYSKADISPVFRVNGFATPTDATYAALVAGDFSGYRLEIGGEVDRPLSLSLAQIARFPQRTQITRHDCVEGWSVIGQWSGAVLWPVLAAARPRRSARYAVFRCMDTDGSGVAYYESLDILQAHHPQTLLATQLNGAPIDPDHGAPVRLRVPTQLGYKSAKWVARIELLSSFSRIEGGNGGYWEDQGYEWYAGI
jgi:DMSO/TMAO reductase YedYZ molybdopterin-dependent catalytic subunit